VKWGNGHTTYGDTDFIAEHEAHYNVRLNECIVRLSVQAGKLSLGIG